MLGFLKGKAARNLPLDGINVVEFAGLAPGPFTGMMLADFGANVIRIDRPGSTTQDVLCRHKRSIAVSPKSESGKKIILQLISKADIVIDPYRPGVLERLGLGPEVIAGVSNGKCILARLTGYQRHGAYSKLAGHDINYIAMSGILSLLKPPHANVPVPPLNILGDFAGGGMMCVAGILLALIERTKSGKGQVVEADMVTGTRYLSTFVLLSQLKQSGSGFFDEPTGQNPLDGGAPFYMVYKCKDGKFLSVGCLEPHFYNEFVTILHNYGPPDPEIDGVGPETSQFDRSKWPQMKAYFARIIRTKTRSEWTDIYKGTDSCVAPVLEPAEVDTNAEDGIADRSFDTQSNMVPQVTPTLQKTPAKHSLPSYATNQAVLLQAGKHTLEILNEMGLSSRHQKALLKEGIVTQIEENFRSKL